MIESNEFVDKIEDLGEFSIKCCVKRIDGEFKLRFVWECVGSTTSCPWEGYKTFKEVLKSLSEVKYK